MTKRTQNSHATNWKSYEGWGRYPVAQSLPIWLQDQNLPLPSQTTSGPHFVLPYGMGRSYGDSCLNDGHYVLETRGLNHYLGFDEDSGVLKVESGVTLADIIATFAPRGWFPAVVPGTKFVTVGGAIANDVHGKNHAHAGTFGCHVSRFELLRSDGAFLCSEQENPELFAATIGGLGLTGLISWAEIRLRPIPSPFVSMQNIRFDKIEDYFSIAEASEHPFEHTVAWIDCLAPAKARGRGHFTRGNWSSQKPAKSWRAHRASKLSFPFEAPNWLMGPTVVKSFNRFYFHRQSRRIRSETLPFEPFFFPLDAIGRWNRLYGKQGFLQYQCVLPGGHETLEPLRDLLDRIAAAKTGSFLVVLKSFGPRKSPGLLSFPREGVTLALDFPNTGEKLLSLLSDLDHITAAAGGRVYPAKDARLSPALFSQYYPAFEIFQKHIDPAFSSSFLRRVT